MIRLFDRVQNWLQGLLFSSRPQWLMMPGYVATNFVDNVLFLLSAMERHEIDYVVHFGTLLGSVRMGAVLPWDEDADVYAIGEDRASIEAKIGDVLRSHGFDLSWEEGGFFWVRQDPWWPDHGIIGLSLLPDVQPGATVAHSYHDDPGIAHEQLHPLKRYPFHGTWVWGPAEVESLLARIYGKTGTVDTMSRFRAPRIGPETEAFWMAARSDALDWQAISARFHHRRERRRWAHLVCFPWWWASKTFNHQIWRLRPLGDAMERFRIRRSTEAA